MDVDEEEESGPPNADSRLLDVFILGVTPGCPEGVGRGSTRAALPGLLGCVDTHSLTRCSRLCRRARELVGVEHVWEPRVRAACKLWGLATPKVECWREQFFNLDRPRCDGIYLGECTYIHRIRPGASMEAKLMNRTFHWVEYRRYIRLLPPDPQNGTRCAFVLRDVCPFEVAAELLAGLEPRARVVGVESEQHAPEHRSTTSLLRSRVAAGTWEQEGSRIQIRVTSGRDTLSLALDLRNGSYRGFSGRLDWLDYYMTDEHEQVTRFNLGRSPHGDGEPSNREKDHYPSLFIRPCPSLEHFL
mmetsp:Transcript_92156/g.298081  ORF Transcript_92156/g.298081 Transcript_92156/m.298081 type:complete len:302 (-) Transcript_92156:8-913(-)